jgi:hypothetical protein
MLAAAIAVAALALAARIAVRFKPGLPGDFHPERDAEPLTRLADPRSRSVTGTDGNRVSPTLAQRSGRSTRFAGLGSGSTRTTAAGRLGRSFKQLGRLGCCWENEPGLVGIPYLGWVIGNTSYHTIPSRMTP